MDSNGMIERQMPDRPQFLEDFRGTGDTSEEIDFRKLIPVFRRRMKIIVAVFLAVIILTIVISYLNTPIYCARTKVMLALGTKSTQRNEEIPLMTEYFETWDVERNLHTQMEIIKSRPIMEEAAKRLNEIMESNGRSNGKKNGKKKNNNSISAGALLGMIGVQTLKDTNIVIISAEGPDPEIARDGANIVSQTYIDETRKMNQEVSATVRKFIEEQLVVARGELNKTDQAVRSFKEKRGIADLDAAIQAKVTQAAELETRYNELNGTLKSTQAKIAEVRSQIGKEDPKVIGSTSIVENPIVSNLKSKLTELEIKKSSLLEEYGEKHPEVIAINTEIKATRDSLNKSVKEIVGGKGITTNPLYQKSLIDYADLQAEAYGLNASLDALSQKLAEKNHDFATLPGLQFNLANLQRANEVALKTYMILLEKLQNYKIAEASNLGSAHIIETATTPQSPVKPNKPKNVMYGALLGLFLALVGAFALEYFDDTVKNQEDLETVIHLTTLGIVPLLPQDDMGRIFSGEKDMTVAADSFRVLRSNVRFFSLDKPLKTLMVTSAIPGEGKSTMVYNLAISFAQSEKKVLIIDADLRNSALHRFCNLSRAPGLTNILVEDMRLDEAIRPTGAANLDIISGGITSPNPVELLDSQKMHKLIEQLKSRYDIILFDTPPLGTLPDAMVLSTMLDGTLIVASAGQTPRGALQKTVRSLGMGKSRIIGTALNKLDYRKHDYYYYYYYYHYSYDRRGQGDDAPDRHRRHHRNKK